MSQTTTLVILFWYTHETQGRIKQMVWTFGLMTSLPLVFYFFFFTDYRAACAASNVFIETGRNLKLFLLRTQSLSKMFAFSSLSVWN